jgi:molybdopterin molybdotransferase
VVVPAGAVLGPPELAALAAIGLSEPEVARVPRCAHLVTGSEIVAPDRIPAGAQIRDSNSTLIATLLTQHRAALVGHARVSDDPGAARAALEAMAAHDVLLISGGAGDGDRDFARPLLEALGYELHFQAVNLRPGKPLVFASRGDQLAFTLPGNPVSHWVVFQLFIAPLVRFLQDGKTSAEPLLAGRVATGSRLPPPDPRPTYWPCQAAIVAGMHELTLLRLASSGDGCGLVGANALLPVPAPPATLAPGQAVDFIPCP